ncbi:PREDICTED: cytidine deaminase-like [Amphimedon queenslandica]|uniref:Cytidine deaminase n=1 Tax=Amphimedon queenslandica TaxID=400682 RepID=A0A1X7VPT2_AMPQE|nr:PREDICTED: cytidine deaminase-like [Amphimedon queenslandica]|eukprot:XP_003383498.1 PREDICTED: cytidine deaminase-like [Amphimedon queenslandica]
MSSSDNEDLVQAALEARSRAHCPYSNFQVGAALRTKSGKVVTGSNIENAAYPLSTCAERVAITKCVSSLENKDDKKIVAIAVATKLDDQFPSPCGGCRQIIAEFGWDSNCQVILVKASGATTTTSIQELLPKAFLPDVLIKE